MSPDETTSPPTGWRRLCARLGLDQRVISGLGARMIPMMASPISSVITVWCLTTESQGLFYLFASLLALRALFELGAGTSVLQVAAHARQTGEAALVSPLEPAFVFTVNRWMRHVASIYGLIAGLVGAGFLIYQNHGDAFTLMAWAAFLTVSSAQFASEGRWALLEGADKMAEANRLRMRNTLFQYIIQWLLLLAGASLFSFVGGALAAYASQEFGFRTRYRWLYGTREPVDPERAQHFRSELLVLIKKASQTYLTGYLVFQAQQPICFHLLGAVGSARLGFTQMIGATLIGIPTVWLAVNFPRLAHAVADGKIDEARQLFKARFITLIGLTVCAIFGAWIATFILSLIPRFADRLMDPASILILYTGIGIQTVALGMTYWPRAFKIEPFVRVAYAQMVVTPLLLWWLCASLGLRGVSIAIVGSWTVGLAGIVTITWQYWVTPVTPGKPECVR